MSNFKKIRAGVVNMLKVNMQLKDRESILIVNDFPIQKEWALPYPRIKDMASRSLLARQIFDLIRDEFKHNRIDYLAYPSMGQHGTEPPTEVAEKLLEYEVAILLTTYSLSHTEAREKATKKGARIASMPGIEDAMFADDGPMAADYSGIRKESEEWAELLTRGKMLRVVTGYGTDLTFSIEGRPGGADTGILEKAGDWGNLPGGEAFIAPVEGTANGKMVVPRGWFFGLEEDMTLKFKDGYVVALQGGGQVGEEFSRLLSFDDDRLKHRRNCAELGIGTNPKARKPDNVLEAEKIKGTVHIAIGDSSHLGGVTQSDLHEDFVLPEPVLYIDGKISN